MGVTAALRSGSERIDTKGQRLPVELGILGLVGLCHANTEVLERKAIRYLVGKGSSSLSSRRLTGDGATPPASNEMVNLTNPYGA